MNKTTNQSKFEKTRTLLFDLRTEKRPNERDCILATLYCREQASSPAANRTRVGVIPLFTLQDYYELEMMMWIISLDNLDLQDQISCKKSSASPPAASDVEAKKAQRTISLNSIVI
jgi:hypothetical protein